MISCSARCWPTTNNISGTNGNSNTHSRQKLRWLDFVIARCYMNIWIRYYKPFLYFIYIENLYVKQSFSMNLVCLFSSLLTCIIFSSSMSYLSTPEPLSYASCLLWVVANESGKLCYEPAYFSKWCLIYHGYVLLKEYRWVIDMCFGSWFLYTTAYQCACLCLLLYRFFLL
jgi:hypothetical protein